MRRLNANEAALVTGLVANLDEATRSQAMKDLANAAAVPVTEDNSRIVFDITGYARPAYHGQHAIGREAKMRDRDDAALSIVLYADENGRLLELEFIRWAGGALQGPNWGTLEFVRDAA
jgi:hypothetical protein